LKSEIRVEPFCVIKKVEVTFYIEKKNMLKNDLPCKEFEKPLDL